MRCTFIRTLVEIAERDHRILFLTGDLGYSIIEPFADKFPERFFNVGVAEQNMIGLATGLAEAGFIPFVYSISTFVSLRAYEFIRNGPVLHHCPVRIVGVGEGFEYGHNGASHYGLEDVGLMRMQPGMTVVVPADFTQARSALLTTWSLPGPIYFRLGKDDETVVPGLDGRFELGRVQLIGEGTDLLVIAMGSTSKDAVSAVEKLAGHGFSCTIMVVASVAPAPIADLLEVLTNYRWVMTVEAHNIVGGIGSLISEVIAEYGLDCQIVRCGVKSLSIGLSGSKDFLEDLYGLSSEKLATTALQILCSTKVEDEN